MIYIKKLNLEDIEKEYQFLQEFPSENGFNNKQQHLSFEYFLNQEFPMLINHARGINLPTGFVPYTIYFLWKDDLIVGLFKFRHYLNDHLKEGSGHIGFGIHPKYRNQGYATKGLNLLLHEIKPILLEDEIYMCCYKDNDASKKVQINNGAYFHHEDEDDAFYRIKKEDIK